MSTVAKMHRNERLSFENKYKGKRYTYRRRETYLPGCAVSPYIRVCPLSPPPSRYISCGGGGYIPLKKITSELFAAAISFFFCQPSKSVRSQKKKVACVQVVIFHLWLCALREEVAGVAG